MTGSPLKDLAAASAKRQRRQSVVKQDGKGGNVYSIEPKQRAVMLASAKTIVEVVPILEWETEASVFLQRKIASFAFTQNAFRDFMFGAMSRHFKR
jgi:hypothetical protein